MDKRAWVNLPQILPWLNGPWESSNVVRKWMENELFIRPAVVLRNSFTVPPINQLLQQMVTQFLSALIIHSAEDIAGSTVQTTWGFIQSWSRPPALLCSCLKKTPQSQQGTARRQRAGEVEAKQDRSQSTDTRSSFSYYTVIRHAIPPQLYPSHSLYTVKLQITLISSQKWLIKPSISFYFK